jgi:ATP-dependent DNA helicase RecQ
VVTDIVNSAGWQKPEDAVRGCAPLLISFVYDTIERARRRSLREMWLAARESAGDAEIRTRILDFLTEGDVAPRLERLLDQQVFAFQPWITELDQVVNVADAREWRGTTARLLASYPDHPGLLLGRAISEVTDPGGNLHEFGSAIEAAARSALRRYNATNTEVASAMHWAYDHIHRLGRPDGAAVLLATLSRLDIAGEAPWSGLIAHARSDFPHSAAVAAACLPDWLHASIRELDDLLAHEVEIR